MNILRKLMERLCGCGKHDDCEHGQSLTVQLRLGPADILESDENGIVKNSDGSDVCTLFDAAAFSRLVGEGLPHPLTREPITASIIVKHEECIYDDTRGNFVIKGN
ncbi:DUF1076 domain-containing protein [Escherichia coli]|nr:DUF1076 domain-containing protein [Escherichia coli]